MGSIVTSVCVPFHENALLAFPEKGFPNPKLTLPKSEVSAM